MINKNSLLFVFGVLFLISFLSMTSAAVRLELVNESNISGSAYFLNSSITGLTGNVNIGNVSFWYQIFGGSTWTLIARTNNVSVNQSWFNTTWNTTAVADGKNYTLNVTSYDYPSNDTVNATNITVSVTIDNTPPLTAGVGYTNATLRKNTEKLTLNISVTDATVGLYNTSAAYCFVDVNGTNETIPLSGGWCNSSLLNLTGLSDGNKTIKIYANDTLNNLVLNSTLVVKIDTTVPISSPVCSPSTVNTGDSFPCTCTGTDATAGVSTSVGSSTSNSITSTANTGTFTYTCTVTDSAGNIGTATATYSVEQYSSNTGGTTTTMWTKTQTLTNSVFENGYTGELGVRNRMQFKIGSESHHVGIVSISGSKAVIEISSTPINITLSAGENASVDVDDDGFYDVYVLLNDIINNKANITLQKIHEEIPEGGSSLTTTGETGQEEPPAATGAGSSLTWLWILIGVVALAIIAWLVFKKK